MKILRGYFFISANHPRLPVLCADFPKVELSNLCVFRAVKVQKTLHNLLKNAQPKTLE